MTLEGTKIELNGLKFHAFHGITAEERRVGSDFEVNVALFLAGDLESFEKDSLDKSINYAEAYQLIQKEFCITSKLLENVATRIAETLFRHFELLEKVEVKVEKVNPPIQADCHSAAVVIRAKK